MTSRITDKTDNPLVKQFMDAQGIESLVYKPAAEFYRNKMDSLTKEERVELARMNPVIFAEYYLRPFNKKWDVDCEDYQYLLLQVLLEHPNNVVHINVESGKSTWISEVLPLWFLIRNRNLRIGLISRTQRQAERFGRRLMWHVENNYRMREDFGDYLIPDTSEKWTQAEGFVVRDMDQQSKDPSFQFLGINGAIQGARIDVLIADDILDLTNSQSEITRMHVADNFKESFMSRVVDGGRIMMVGTLQSRLDLLCEMSENEEFNYFHMKAVDEATKDTISRRWSYERLMQKKRAIGTVKFLKLFQNDRSAQTGTMLKSEWLQFFGRGEDSPYPVVIPPLEHLKIYIGIDPAIADKDVKEKMENNRLDYFALCVIGHHPQSQRLFIIENFKDRLSLQQQLQTIQEYYDRYRPLKIGIESVAYQKALAQAAWSLDAKIPIKELKTHGGLGSKEARIEAMGALFEVGRIWVHPDNTNFLDEYLHYPDIAHDDVLDSVELTIRLVGDTGKKNVVKGIGQMFKL